LDKRLSADPTLTPSLPEPQGTFQLPSEKNFAPRVAFAVSAASDGQRVTVTHKTPDYSFESQYFVRGTSVQPERLFAGHAMSMLVAVVIGLVGAEALFHLLRAAYRRFSSRPGNSIPIAP